MNPNPPAQPYVYSAEWSANGRVFEPPTPTDTFGFVVLALVLAMLLGWLVVRWRVALSVFDGLGRRAGLVLAGVVAAQFVIAVRWVPHAPWHTNMHGFFKYIDVADAAALSPPELRLHGLGFYTLLRLLVRLGPDGAVSPYDAMTGITAAALVAFGAYLWSTTARRDVTVLGVALLVCTPAHLRLSASDSYFIPIELFVVAGLAAWELHVRYRTWDTLVVAIALIGFAANCHLEMALFAPMLLAVHAGVRAPEVARRALQQPVAWLTALVLASPHVVVALLDAREGDMPVVANDGLLGTLSLHIFHVIPPLLVTVAALTVLWRRRTRWSAPPGGMPTWAACAVGAALVIAPFLPLFRAEPYSGFDQRFGFHPLHLLHFVFNLNYTPALEPILFLAGTLWLSAQDVRSFTRLVIPTCVMWMLYAGQYDSVATYIRFGLAMQWLMVAVMASAAAAAVDALVRASRRGEWGWLTGVTWALLLVPSAQSFSTLASWVAWEYPTQADYRVLAAGAEAASGHGALYTLTPDDFPQSTRARFPVENLRYAPVFLRARSGVGIEGASALLGATDDGSPRFWVRGANCFRAPTQWHDDVSPLEIVIGDRAIRVPHPTGPKAPPMVWRNARSWEDWNLDASVPCRHQEALATCVHTTDAGCELWQYPDNCDGSPPPFEQPACAAVEAAWVMEAIMEVRTNRGTDNQVEWGLLQPEATLGVYRVLRRR